MSVAPGVDNLTTMIHKLKTIILVACLLIGLFLAHKSVVAQSQTSVKSGTGVVNGLVTVEGKPVPSVTVVIARCEGWQLHKYPSPATTITSDEGQFHFDSLAGNRAASAAFHREIVLCTAYSQAPVCILSNP